MGTAKTVPTIPLNNKPTFASIARLDIPLSAVIAILLSPGLRTNSCTDDLGIVAVGRRATPRRRQSLGATWVGPRCRCASLEHPTQVVQQLLLFEVVGHSLARDRSHRRSISPF